MTMFIVTPEENGTLKKITYSVGPNDASLNGYILLTLSRIQNTNMFITSQAHNQIIWTGIFQRSQVNVEYFMEPVYLYKGEPLYIQGVSNFPAPAMALGQLKLEIAPAFR